ncbi:TonB-dependent receptor domain-containing protein [Pedobacter sp. MR2016-24]|uniref:TonB-dependent receptor domain-containing protein n=1 Tax=Pedobacter sp. MR2016-24 TaxID=2994466 RepID=UPI0022467801|nr:TonB-dependent receptor [Pedobacter sp. MR2016-24]MCX2484973.1 TonB-dependent receptor [Pedobacter sp. MR2016-24]
MKTIFYFLLLCFPFQLSAQQKVTGVVSDEQGETLDAATVTLSQNGQVISSQLADQGQFTFSGMNQGVYQLSVSLIGYKASLRSFTMPKDTLAIILLNENRQLNEVAVTFKKPTIERKIDRVVFNVENSIMASSGNAWDALGKSPGVQTTNEGTIKANNKGAVVYLDGKPFRLSGDDLAAYLQSIPADQLSKIEVMPNPSAKYEAQGGAVINIISKKTKTDGFNTSLSGAYTRGALNRYTGNGVFNYRKNKLNVFGSYGYSDRDIQRDLNTFTIYETPNSYAYWDLKRRSLGNTRASNYSAGADYNLTGKQVIGLLVTGNNSAGSSESKSITNIFNHHNVQPDSILYTNTTAESRINQYSFNVNYKVQLDSAGRSLNIDVDYVPYTRNNTQGLSNHTVLSDGSQSASPYQISSPAAQRINIWSGKLDYNYQLGKTWAMASGAKYTSIVSENQFDFFNTAGTVPVPDPSKSDQFDYTENTCAAYTDLSGASGKWILKAGLRAEYTRTKGNSQSLDSINTNSYLRIFPSIFITYKASENNEFGFTYAKRIERPDYRQLNPAKSYSSPYNYQNGNPFLKPSIINSLQLNYTLHHDYTFAAVYTQIDDMSSNVTVQDNVNQRFYDTQLNIGRIQELGAELSAVHHPAPWWEINHLAQGYYRTQKSDQPGNTYNYRQFYFYLRTDHAFTLNKNNGLKAELSAWYNSAVQQGTLWLDKTHDLSAGISKPLFNKQATLRLSAADLLYGNPYRIRIDNQGQNNGIYQKNDTRTFTLSFTYKLGKSMAASRKRITASEEEKKRTN